MAQSIIGPALLNALEALDARLSELEQAPARDARPRVYTAETLSRELGVSARAVRSWIASGELEAVKRSGRWVMTASAVEQWASKPAARPARRRGVAGHKSVLRDALNEMNARNRG